MALTIGTALQQGVELLEKADVGAPRLTAEVLLTHALQQGRTYLYAHSSDELKELHWIHYGRYLHERMQGKPTQYITHRQEFYGRDFFVNTSVLIPRPETEHLTEAALKHIRGHQVNRVLDVGTGSGAIAITLACEARCAVLASDISPAALHVAERNRKRHEAAVQFFAADLLDSVMPGSIDLLVSNPPYVPGADAANMQREVRDWEPQVALFAGESGLEIYARLIRSAESVLAPAGRLFMELGYQSLNAVQGMLASKWHDISVVQDLAGWPRVIGATLRTA